MSGQWPPEWEDPEEEFTEGAEDATELANADEARLSEVTACLASVPVPAMPEAVETRIRAALATEADWSRLLGPSPARARVRRRALGRQGGGERRRNRLHGQARGIGLVVVCLLLAGLGFVLSRGAPESESSSAAGSAAGPNTTQGATAAGSASAAESSAAGAVPRPSALGPQDGSASGVSFAVTASGTQYERATLAEQVRGRLAANSSGQTSGSSSSAAPSATLRGCVHQVAGGALLRLVDRATYQGEPAYVIASSARVWVVGLGCTAAKTELVASVALAGLPGNLRALVSVEQ